MSRRGVRWKPLEGTGKAADLANDLRSLIEVYLDENPDVRTVTAFARQAGLSPAAVSGATSGQVVPSAATVDAIVKAAARDHGVDEQVAAFRAKRRGASEAPVFLSTDALIQEIEDGCRIWDQFEPADPEYRDFNRLPSEAKLIQFFSLARDHLLDDKSGELWAYLVVAAVQHGSNYRHWYKLAAPRHEISVIEGLIEVITMRVHRSPRWRAAWLLQRIQEPQLKAATMRLIRSMPVIEDPDQSGVRRLIDAIENHSVESALQATPEVELPRDRRNQLMAEFRTQVGVNAARGRLRDYLASGDIEPVSQKPPDVDTQT